MIPDECMNCGSPMAASRCPACGGIRSVRASETGSQTSNGPVGAPGPSISDSAQQAQARIAAYIIREAGSNTYQGRAFLISWPSKEGLVAEFTAMVYFDSETGGRLQESLCGDRGGNDTDGAGYFHMTLIEERPST